MRIKTWSGTHPEEVTSKADIEIADTKVHHVCTVKSDREFILTICYEVLESPAKEIKPVVMRCG